MNLYVHQSARGGDGPDRGAVVFLHGFPFDASMWAHQLGDLPHGWRGIAPDLRGFGATGIGALSGEVPTGKRIGNRIARANEPVLTMARLADDVAELIAQRADGAAVVCGLSMGGYVALELWRRHPERVRALVLSDTRASADSDETRENRLRLAQTVRTSGLRPIAAAMIPTLLSEATRKTRSDMVERVRTMILGAPPESIIAALAGMAARHDATGRLSEIRVPTLVMAGEHDTITPPAEGRAMADAIPHATFEEIPGAAHLANLENADAFNAAMTRFLTAVERSG